jgi:hypothetical protein
MFLMLMTTPWHMPQTFQIKKWPIINSWFAFIDPSQNWYAKNYVLVIMPLTMTYSMGLMGFFNMFPNYMTMNPSYGTTFNNPKVGYTTRIQNQHLYPTNIPQHWTPIQPISKEIQVSANSNHVITCTQYQI